MSRWSSQNQHPSKQGFPWSTGCGTTQEAAEHACEKAEAQEAVGMPIRAVQQDKHSLKPSDEGSAICPECLYWEKPFLYTGRVVWVKPKMGSKKAQAQPYQVLLLKRNWWHIYWVSESQPWNLGGQLLKKPKSWDFIYLFIFKINQESSLKDSGLAHHYVLAQCKS